MNNVENFMGMDFYGPKRTINKTKKMDVSVSKTMSGFDIFVRNDKGALLGDRVRLCINGKCIVFLSSDTGWKVSGASGTGTTVIRIAEGALPPGLNGDFVGDYDLKYLEPVNLYYVEKSENVEGQ